jgi:hypothetical protein
MSGLYAICSRHPQKHLSRRRHGYAEYEVGGSYAYIREEHNSPALGRRDNGRIHMLDQFRDDVTSVAADAEASFFFVEMTDGESVEDAIGRGLGLRLSKSREPWLMPDQERRPVTG